jgi:hypothetical protein
VLNSAQKNAIIGTGLINKLDRISSSFPSLQNLPFPFPLPKNNQIQLNDEFAQFSLLLFGCLLSFKVFPHILGSPLPLPFLPPVIIAKKNIINC